MNISGSLAIVVIFVLVSTAGQHVYAQYGGAPTTSTANDYKVTINSDKPSYAIGETITLSGNVSKYEENRTLQITIFHLQSLEFLWSKPVYWQNQKL